MSTKTNRSPTPMIIPGNCRGVVSDPISKPSLNIHPKCPALAIRIDLGKLIGARAVGKRHDFCRSRTVNTYRRGL